jgi:hypothetical protein
VLWRLHGAPATNLDSCGWSRPYARRETYQSEKRGLWCQVPCLWQMDVSVAFAGSRTGQALQFFSWRGGQRAVGSPIVEPRWLAWDPDVTLCALAYEASAVALLSHCALVPATHVLLLCVSLCCTCPVL